MLDQIADLIPSYRAAIQTEITKHRQMNGDVGTVDTFVADVEKHHARYGAKLDNLRASTTMDGTLAACDAASAQIAAITTTEIARVRAAGVVEFAS